MTEHASHAWVWMYCSRDRQARVATFRSSAGEWQLTAVGEPEPGGEGGTGPGLPVTGRFGLAPGYRGCPGCESDAYVRCGACGALGCWHSTETHQTCGNCGHRGQVGGELDSLGALDLG